MWLKRLFVPVLALGALAFSSSALAKEEKVESASAWSGTQTCSVSASYYSSCDNLYGDFLKEALSQFNTPKSPSYQTSRFKQADEAEGDSSKVLSIYTRHNIPKDSICSDNYAWDRWNREHIFTQTKFQLSKEDNHNVFACEGKINQIRGDDKFKQLDNVTTTISVFDHDTGCKSNGTYFEPCDDAKGEVARACLYVSVYYPYKLTDIFYDVATCLKWHAEHPVTQREIYRNNKVYSLQLNRNPFVDHPSYANKIYEGYTQYTAPDPIDGSVPGEATKVTGLSLNETEKYLAVGGTFELIPTFEPANASNRSYEVMNSNYTVASIKKNPNSITITALAEGTAKITVKANDGGYQAECRIIVNKDGKAPDNDSIDLGCSGSVIASSVLICLTSIVGFTLLGIKKKKE